MKFYKLLLTGMLVSSNWAFACDICGCSSQGMSLGLLPGSSASFIGLRYNFRHFFSVHPPIGNDPGGQITKDYFHSAEIWGRYSPFKRFELYGFIPLKYSIQKEQGINRTSYGVGDVSILISGVIIQSDDSLSRGKMKHRWSIGLGVKAPTGASHRIEPTIGVVLPNMQPGTGSWDFSIVSNYHFFQHNWGLNVNASYRYNLPNKYRYQFGGRFLLSANALRKIMFPLKNFTLIPQLGVRLDYAQRDYQNISQNKINEYSGGYFLHGQFRIDCYIKSFGINLALALPIAQHYGQGYVHSRYTITAGIKFLFKSKKQKK